MYKTLLLYCLKCRKIQNNGRIMLLSKCVLREIKKSKLMQQQEASELISSLGMKTL